MHYQSAYWRTLREQCFARDNYRCRLCNSPDTLQAHHRTYERFGHELLDDVTTLCEPCHVVVTDYQRRTRYTVRALPAFEAVAQPQTSMLVVAKKEVLQIVDTAKQSDHAIHIVSTRQEVFLETHTNVPIDRGCPAADALWTTRRPLEPLDESH